MRAQPTKDRATTGRIPIGAWLFAALLWAFATLWLGGDLGKLADDWSQHVRDPATGRYAWPPFELTSNFWRPLHLVLVESLQTLLWNHDRVNHAVSAAAHGVCTLLLYRVLRSAGCARRSAGAAAVLFLVYPAPWEVIFWPAALSTGVAAGLLLVMAWLVCRTARRGGGLAYGALPLLGFGLCCLNEQPGAVTPALALLALASAGPARWSRRSLGRAALLGAASMLGCAVYALLYLWSAPAGARGTAESLVPLDQLGARLESLLPLIAQRTALVGFARGALGLGFERLDEYGVPALLAATGTLGCGAWWWWRWWMREDHAAPDQGVARTLLLIAFGLLGAALAWAPLVLIARYGAPSRATYVPGLCLAFVLAPLMDLAGARAAQAGGRGRITRALTCLLLIAASLLGAAMLIGVQGLLRARSRLDLAQAASLRGALPDPPRGAVFLPLSMRDRPVRTGSAEFDQAAIGAFRLGWSAPALVRSAFGRSDLDAGACWHQRTREVALIDARGVVLRSPLGGATPIGEGRFRLPWESVVPFEIDELGHAAPITHLNVSRAGAAPLEIEPPLLKPAVAAGRCAVRRYRFEAWEGP